MAISGRVGTFLDQTFFLLQSWLVISSRRSTFLHQSKTFDFSNRELRTEDRYLYQNASKNPIFFGQFICPSYRLLRIQLNARHIVALEHESACSPFSKMLSYAGCGIEILNGVLQN